MEDRVEWMAEVERVVDETIEFNHSIPRFPLEVGMFMSESPEDSERRRSGGEGAARPGPGKETLVLIGARAAGKTTVGRLVAERLGWAFEDLDTAIERRAGRTITDIFSLEGEPAFREREAAALAERTSRTRLILATGGGAILRPENRRALRDFGPVVWLRADPKVLAARLEADPRGRPSLTGADPAAEIAQVLRDREALYRETADIAVATEGRTVEGVVVAVLHALRELEAKHGGPN